MNNKFQNSFMSIWFNAWKIIRSKKFLEEIDKIIPYERFLKIIAEKYESWAKTWRPKYDLKMMIRIYFLAQFYNLWDLAMEEAIYDRISFQEFLWIDILSSSIPDETTILNFRHLLEENKLQEKLFEEVLNLIKERWYFFERWTIVDATIIKASGHTKNKTGKRDPEMSSTKKNNNFHFWMKAHIWVDSQSWVVHSVTTTTAKTHDKQELQNLLHWNEKAIFWDKAYWDKKTKKEARKNWIFYWISDKGSRHMKISSSQKKKNKKLSCIRSKVEHVFRILKCQFNFRQVRYRWLEKNDMAIKAKLALWNLYLMRRKLAT